MLLAFSPTTGMFLTRVLPVPLHGVTTNCVFQKKKKTNQYKYCVAMCLFIPNELEKSVNWNLQFYLV